MNAGPCGVAAAASCAMARRASERSGRPASRSGLASAPVGSSQSLLLQLLQLRLLLLLRLPPASSSPLSCARLNGRPTPGGLPPEQVQQILCAQHASGLPVPCAPARLTRQLAKICWYWPAMAGADSNRCPQRRLALSSRLGGLLRQQCQQKRKLFPRPLFVRVGWSSESSLTLAARQQLRPNPNDVRRSLGRLGGPRARPACRLASPSVSRPSESAFPGRRAERRKRCGFGSLLRVGPAGAAVAIWRLKVGHWAPAAALASSLGNFISREGSNMSANSLHLARDFKLRAARPVRPCGLPAARRHSIKPASLQAGDKLILLPRGQLAVAEAWRPAG